MQFLCECLKIDCEIDCDARGRWLRSCPGHQITQGRHWMKLLIFYIRTHSLNKHKLTNSNLNSISTNQNLDLTKITLLPVNVCFGSKICILLLTAMQIHLQDQGGSGYTSN